MKKISINLKGLSLDSLLKKNLSITLWAFLGVVLIAESFIIYTEVRKVSQVQSDPNVVQSQIVRVNLEQHKKMEESLNENESFQTRVIPGGASFGIAPTSTPSP